MRQVGKLNQIINEAEAERMKQQKEYDIVVNERDILGTQLIKRNDGATPTGAPPARALCRSISYL